MDSFEKMYSGPLVAIYGCLGRSAHKRRREVARNLRIVHDVAKRQELLSKRPSSKAGPKFAAGLRQHAKFIVRDVERYVSKAAFAG